MNVKNKPSDKLVQAARTMITEFQGNESFLLVFNKEHTTQLPISRESAEGKVVPT